MKLKSSVQNKLLIRLDGLVTKLNYWKDAEPRYSFKLKPLGDE